LSHNGQKECSTDPLSTTIEEHVGAATLLGKLRAHARRLKRAR
jgi:hypothetical protein